MRWHFADRIDAFEPWDRIRGRKSVSLEEYYLLEPLGREGEFPESLILETCVHFARWLVAASTDFQSLALLNGVHDFQCDATVREGARLDVHVRLERGPAKPVTALCTVSSGESETARGTLTLEIIPAADYSDPAELRMLWTELHGTADRKN